MSTITLTDGLVKRIRALQEQDGKPDLKLRILVDGGGCQGFEYKFSLTSEINPDDEIFEKDGVAVVIDDISLPYMRGAEVDYTDDLIGAYFKINNPNAVSTCGCGTSFSTAD
jgi:iron-sulfur cluster insertion protein